MSKHVEKDPFQEYDKFWDKLDKTEDAKNDEDYFKDKKINSFQEMSRSDRDKYRHNKMIEKFFFSSATIFVFGLFMMFIIVSRINSATIQSFLSSAVLFVIFASIVLSILKKLKYK